MAAPGWSTTRRCARGWNGARSAPSSTCSTRSRCRADSPLWQTPNLIVTPHCSSDDTELYIPRTLDLFFENMRRFLAGEPLENRVDPVLEY